MKKQILIIATIAALTAVSCTKTDIDQPQQQADKPIEVNATIEDGSTTKVIVEQTSELIDITFLHIVNYIGDPFTFEGQTPFNGSRIGDATGAIIFDDGQTPMYDKTGLVSRLLAYHPKGVLSNDTVIWVTDGVTDILNSDVWEAGTYTTSTTTGLTLQHVLTRLEVIVQSNQADQLEAAKDIWGKITKIVVKDIPTTSMLNCKARNPIADIGPNNAPFALLKGNSYTHDPFTPVDIEATGSTSVVASAMLPFGRGRDEVTFVVSSEKQPDMEVVVKSASLEFLRGKLYTITLTCDPDKKTITPKTTIGTWTLGGTMDNNLTNPPAVIIEYGKPPYNITTGIPNSTRVSYNGFWGHSDETTNGPYQTTIEDAYTNEPPYAKFEVAINYLLADNDDLGWFQFELCSGTTQGDNICATRLGAGWRLPRISELKLIMLNKDELKKTAGFSVVPNNLIMSATQSSGNGLWFIFKNGDQYSERGGSIADIMRVRCIRERP